VAYRRFGRFFQRAQGARRRAGGRRALPPGLRNTRRPRGRNRARGRLYYIHTDHLGTPRAITNRRGTVVWRWGGEPFGASRPDEDPDHNHRRFRFNLRFPGQYFDAETGLNYNYFRDYDPRTGRYVESDPIGLGGGLGTYSYVGNSPLQYMDVFGEAAMTTCQGDGGITCTEARDIARQSMGLPARQAAETAAAAEAGDGAGTNVIPFPGKKSESKPKEKDYCPPNQDKDDQCQKDKDRIEANIRIGLQNLDQIRNPLQRRKQYLRWAKSMNEDIKYHNISCPHHQVKPLPL